MKRVFLAALLSLQAIPLFAQAQAPPRAEGWVVLAVEDYQALRDKAFPPVRPPDGPAVVAAITRVEYDLRVQGDSAVGQARLTADVFRDGWVSLPIPAGLRVREAQIEGRAVPLIELPDGRAGRGRAVLLSRAGRSLVTLEVSARVASKAAIESLALPVSSAPVQRIALTLGATDLALTVTNGFVAERASLTQATRFLVCGHADEPLILSWGRRREATPAAQPLRLRGNLIELVALGEDAAQISAQAVFEVVQGVAERVSLGLPAGLVPTQVSGALVADWEARGNELVVTLIEPTDRPIGVTISGEARTAREGRIAVPLLRLVGTERETGGVAVEVLGAGEIKDRSVAGLDPGDPSELGDMVRARQSPALVAFRLRPQPADVPRSLEVTVARYTPQAVLLANVEEARYRVLFTEDGKRLVEARYAVRNSQRSFLALTLPPGATLWSTSVDGRPRRPGRSPDGALLLPILKDGRDSNSFSIVTLLYVDKSATWAAEGATGIALPSLDLPVSRTGLRVHYSPRFRLTLEPGVFRESADEGPRNAALARGIPGGVEGGLAGGVAGAFAEPRPDDQRADAELRSLVNEYQRQGRGRAGVGILPIDIPFPSIGPSVYLAAELTPEGKGPEVRFTFKRQGK